MKKLMTIILMGLSLSACAPQFKGEGLKVDAAFQPYLNRFISKSNELGRPVHVNDLTIEFDASMSGPANGSWTLGICYSGGTGNNRITINPTFWNNAYYSAAEKEALLFHELGHCVLGRGHDTTRVATLDASAKLPQSIMYPYHLGAYTYGINYNYYMQELFGVAPSPTVNFYGSNQFDGSNYYANLASVALASVTETKTSFTAKVDGNNYPESIEGLGCGEDDGGHTH